MKSSALRFWCITLLIASCSGNNRPAWEFKADIQLGDIAPVGIASDDEYLWLSDPDNNRVIKMELNGNVLQRVPNLQRPMHIAHSDNKLFVPEYLIDTISQFENQSKSVLPINSKLDAPAGIAVSGNAITVADFYNHRVIFREGDREISMGKEGNGTGELYYPTDVAIHNGLIYVADAYNNRVQIFDKKGKSILIIGDKDNINVATGIAVSDDQLFVTDFYGNRILVYDLDGHLKQTLNANLDKPSDIVIKNNRMFVANYEGNKITIYQMNNP